jgi:hypothetical protein
VWKFLDETTQPAESQAEWLADRLTDPYWLVHFGSAKMRSRPMLAVAARPRQSVTIHPENESESTFGSNFRLDVVLQLTIEPRLSYLLTRLPFELGPPLGKATFAPRDGRAKFSPSRLEPAQRD